MLCRRYMKCYPGGTWNVIQEVHEMLSRRYMECYLGGTWNVIQEEHGCYAGGT